MRLARAFLSAALVCLGCAGAAGQTPAAADGTVLEQKVFDGWDYEQLAPWQKGVYPRETFDALRNSAEVELLKIRYASDGLSVAGFIAKPRRVEGRKLPVIIFNRGGLADGLIGMSNFNYIAEMMHYAAEGFVVVASQYRGVDGAGGKDEVGGADLGDVHNIIKVARSLPYADAREPFMWGYSRGALMTLQLLRDGVPVRAAVLVGAPTDYRALLPGSERFFRASFPDYDRRKEEHLRNRAPILWVDKINTPLLILHGGADNLSPTHSIDLARKMEELGRVYELVVYHGDNHPIILNREDRLRRTVDWFKRPRALSARTALRKVIDEQGVSAAVERYRELKKTQADRYDFSETELNVLGYELLAAGQAKEALEIFKLNVEAYPEAFNTYDSLAEAYAVLGDKELAVKNYKKSLELNPRNTNAADRLRELEKQ